MLRTKCPTNLVETSEEICKLFRFQPEKSTQQIWKIPIKLLNIQIWIYFWKNKSVTVLDLSLFRHRGSSFTCTGSWVLVLTALSRWARSWLWVYSMYTMIMFMPFDHLHHESVQDRCDLGGGLHHSHDHHHYNHPHDQHHHRHHHHHSHHHLHPLWSICALCRTDVWEGVCSLWQGSSPSFRFSSWSSTASGWWPTGYTQHIPTMTKSHHGGNMSLIGFCFVLFMTTGYDPKTLLEIV